MKAHMKTTATAPRAKAMGTPENITTRVTMP